MLLTIVPRFRAVGLPLRRSIRCSVLSPQARLPRQFLEGDLGMDQITQHGKAFGRFPI